MAAGAAGGTAAVQPEENTQIESMAWTHALTTRKTFAVCRSLGFVVCAGH